MPKKQGLYPTFTWWQGVVEDRNDPDKLGRYKVRIFGYHTNDKITLPTEDLPWSVPMQPVTSAAISGVGTSATGLVEGSTVVGFFADGADAQIPVIMGSWGCMSYLPEDENGNVINFDRNVSGFYDPNYVYPRQKVDDKDIGKNILKEADSSRLARGSKASESHYSLIQKRDTRIESIKKAAAPRMTLYPLDEVSIQHPDSDPTPTPVYEQGEWQEPHPQGAEVSRSSYPYNHVRETESGHVFEVDDTPGAGRIHQYHNSGSYEEIQADGTRSVKIVSKDYEIILSDKNLLVKGDFNITVEGDYNLNVLGNKYEDVQGHHFTTVRGNKITKVQGNAVTEILTDESILTVGNRWDTIQGYKGQGVYAQRVGCDWTQGIGGKITHTFAKGINVTVNGDYRITTLPAFGVDVSPEGIKPILAYGDFQVLTSGDITLGTSLIPNFSGTFPSVSIQSAYVNTMATLGHIEVVGITPAPPFAPGSPMGKFTQISTVSPGGSGKEELILTGNVRRTVAVGNVFDTIPVGTYNMFATAGVGIRSGAILDMRSSGATTITSGAATTITTALVTTIKSTGNIVMTAPIINLN